MTEQKSNYINIDNFVIPTHKNIINHIIMYNRSHTNRVLGVLNSNALRVCISSCMAIIFTRRVTRGFPSVVSKYDTSQRN
jgi:hypothetical protein